MANIKYLSELENYEIININDGEKYGTVLSNDILMDSSGNFKHLLLNYDSGKFSLFSKKEFKEIPWRYIRKIGSKTIIIDIEEELLY